MSFDVTMCVRVCVLPRFLVERARRTCLRYVCHLLFPRSCEDLFRATVAFSFLLDTFAWLMAYENSYPVLPSLLERP